MADYIKLVQLASQLDKAYETSSYDSLLQSIKVKGYRVFRNSQGKHKLESNLIFDFFDENVWGGKNSGMTWGE